MKWGAEVAGLKMGEDSRLADPTINFRWSGLPEMTDVLDTNPESLGDEYSAKGRWLDA